MYHPINEPTCTPQLYQLMQIARATVAFALENDATIARDFDGKIPEQRELSRRLGADFLFRHGGNHFLAAVRQRFIQTMEAQRFTGAGDWLWDKPAAIAEPVLRLLVIPLSKKAGILDALTADTDLDGRFANGHFRYPSLSVADTDALVLVSDIMRGFYSEILAGSGVPGEVIGGDSRLDRQAVLRGYLDANRPLKVCPGCDGRPPSVADGKIHEDCDHFFPKSKYPFLSIHPHNLTPYCKDCNQTYKKANDALECKSVTSLTDIYHPYRYPARSEIEVIVERSQADGQPRLRLHPKQDSAQNRARLDSLKWLLNLEARWDGELSEDRLTAKLEEALTYSTQDERAAGVLIDGNGFKRKLELITDTMSRSIGQIVGEVPALAYARWAGGDIDSSSEWYERYRLWNLADITLPGESSEQFVTNTKADAAILVSAGRLTVPSSPSQE